jgi:hypothetical protein
MRILAVMVAMLAAGCVPKAAPKTEPVTYVFPLSTPDDAKVCFEKNAYKRWTCIDLGDLRPFIDALLRTNY